MYFISSFGYFFLLLIGTLNFKISKLKSMRSSIYHIHDSIMKVVAITI